MNNNCGIYCFTNKINNQKYIGQSINLKRRYTDHLRNAYKSNESNYNCQFYKAIREYGFEQFEYNIIELCSESELDEREAYWIAYYDSYYNGYNMTPGGKGTLFYIGKTVEQYDLDGNFIQEYDNVTKAAEALNTYNQTISACCRGEITTYKEFQFKYKEDATRKIKPIKKSARPDLHKAVEQYDLNGNFIKEYSSITEAYEKTHINNISACCSGKQSTAGGYQWKLKKDNKMITTIILNNHDKLGKPVYQYDIDGNFITEYKSQAEAARAINGFQSNIHKCCVNKSKTYKGYIWKDKYLGDKI